MGIFDRFRTLNHISSKSVRSESHGPTAEATRLLEEGMSLEEKGEQDEALNCYIAATKLNPSLGKAHFNMGILLLERNELDDAVAAFSAALRQKPDSAAAHFNKGNAHNLQGQYAEAIKSYQKALELKPDFADAEFAQGVALQETGALEESILCFKRALEIRPDYAEAYFNLGDAMLESGRLSEAASYFRQVIEISPNHAEAYAQLGIVQQELLQFTEAIKSYRTVIELKPDHIGAYNNIGASLSKQGRHKEAAEHYRQALKISPDQAELHSNLGVVLKTLGQHTEAIDCYRRALAIKPDFAEAQSNLGLTLQQLGHLSEASACYNKALTLDPNCIDAANNLGVLQQQMGQLDLAIGTFRRLLEASPNNIEALSNLASVLGDQGKLDEAAATYRQALTIQPDYTVARSNLLFLHNYLANATPSKLFKEAEEFGEVLIRDEKYSNWAEETNTDPNRCLRIGFVSADLRQHPVGYFAEGVLAALHKTAADKIELFAYSNYWRTDAISERIKTCCKGWQMVRPLTDEQLAQMIRDDKIDILFDLSGHTCDNRLPLFALKPAPIQITWLGYFATTGVKEIDYLIADPWTLPETEEKNFTETIWRLPETRLCFTPPNVAIDAGDLPAKRNGFVTFGCFNNLTKMNEQVVSTWASILNSLPTSRLILKAFQLKEPSVREETLKRFSAHGVVADRLILDTYVPRENYLAAYQQVDIALDPFPYPGGTTTVEALWMGVPVLTLSGDSFLARQGVGLLQNAGLSDWIASSQTEYLARAIHHSNDLNRLAKLRSGLREQVLASPIFDAHRFAHHFATALRTMWEKWCSTQKSVATPKVSK